MYSNVQSALRAAVAKVSERRPSLVNHDHLARLDVAHEGRANRVEGAGLGGDDIRAIQLSERQRTQAIGIAEGDRGGRRSSRTSA